jgi:hypothetical protein
MSLDDLVNDIQQSVEPILRALSWAEDEIEAAQRRRPDTADRIGRGFRLLRPTFPRMSNESVYRSHCRELLDRVASGDDTRPGTAAECGIALAETSRRVPLRTSAVGLYTRIRRLAGLPPIEPNRGAHYEALFGTVIDDHEAWLRRKLLQPWRTLPPTGTDSPTRRPVRRTSRRRPGQHPDTVNPPRN